MEKYTLSLLMANGVMVFTGYLILRLQGLLFLIPMESEAWRRA